MSRKQYRNNEKRKQFINSRREKGLCLDCSNIAVIGKRHCQNCSDRIAKNNKSRKEKGICKDCPNSTDGKVYCKDCINRMEECRKKRYENKKTKGLCRECLNEAVGGKSRCENCLAKARNYHREQKKIVLDHYGAKCNCPNCDVIEFEFLTVDHMDNDGAKHRKEISSIFTWIIKNKFPSNIQILCWNCNCAKQYFGGCNHRKK